MPNGHALAYRVGDVGAVAVRIVDRCWLGAHDVDVLVQAVEQEEQQLLRIVLVVADELRRKARNRVL